MGYMLNTVLHLLKTYFKPNTRWKYSINSCGKGLIQELVTTTTATTRTMQFVEYHVKYNTTTARNPPEADHCCGKGKGKQNKGLPS